MKFETFKLERRHWVTSRVARLEAFTEIHQSIDPPFIMMSYSSDRWGQYVTSYIPKIVYTYFNPSAEILLFNNGRLPRPESGTTS